MYLPHIIVRPDDDENRKHRVFQQIDTRGDIGCNRSLTWGMGALKSQLVSRLTTGGDQPYSVYGGNKKYLDDLIYSIIRGQKKIVRATKEIFGSPR